MKWNELTPETLPEIEGSMQLMDDYIMNAEGISEEARCILYTLLCNVVSETGIRAGMRSANQILGMYGERTLSEEAVEAEIRKSMKKETHRVKELLTGKDLSKCKVDDRFFTTNGTGAKIIKMEERKNDEK